MKAVGSAEKSAEMETMVLPQRYLIALQRKFCPEPLGMNSIKINGGAGGTHYLDKKNRYRRGQKEFTAA